MDVDSIFSKICTDLEKNGRVKEISTQFSTFINNEQRVSFVLELEPVQERLVEPLSSLCQSISISSDKSQELSTLHRSEGNQQFQKKLNHQAIQSYNRSVQFAEQGDQLALAYANRSAVLHELGEWLYCLRDIQLAFDTLAYPKHLEYKLYERQGNCLLKLGNRADAFVSFSRAKDAALSSTDSCSDSRLTGIALKLDKLSDMKMSCTGNVMVRDVEEELIASRKPPELNSSSTSEEEKKNVQLPCASTSLRMAYSSEKGRCLVAVEHLQPGTRIIREKAFASVLLEDYKESHCHHCLHPTTKGLVACHRCSQVGYCTVRCRSEAWDSYHRAECRLLDLIHRSGVGKHGLLAFRTLLKVVDRYNHVASSAPSVAASNVYDSCDWSTVHQLVGNSSSRSVADLFRRSVTAVYLSQFVLHNNRDDDPILVASTLLRLLQSYPCNAHEISQLIVPFGDDATVGRAHLNEIGAAAMPVLSLINHSCDPNVVRHCYGDVIVVTVIRPIGPGEEIVDNYGYHYATHPVEERRTKLRQQYFFDCVCPACTHQWPLYRDIIRLSDEHRQLADALRADLESFMQLTCSSAEETWWYWVDKFSRYITRLEDDCNVHRPVGEYNDAQEALKQSLALCLNFSSVGET